MLWHPRHIGYNSQSDLTLALKSHRIYQVLRFRDTTDGGVQQLIELALNFWWGVECRGIDAYKSSRT